MAGAKRVFTIEPGDAFLPRLAESVLSGRLIAGLSQESGPLALADLTIFLPTRRAVRALRSAFAARLSTGGVILPDIRPLGEFGEEAFDLLPAERDGGAGTDESSNDAPPVNPHDRLFRLARLIAAWRSQLPAYLRERFTAGEEVVLPASRADALYMARELATLIDEADSEGGDWSRLDAMLTSADLADWWRVTSAFLGIITEAWPQWLAANGRSNPAAHRAAMIDRFNQLLLSGKPDRPIIAAGSTGSIPATARLLGVIARMPRGAVVLPGLDTGLPTDVMAALSADPAANDDATLPGHPQYGLAQLLRRMGVSARDVESLGASDPALAARQRLISMALLPASATGRWAGHVPEPAALKGMVLVEAANEREEAAAIAVALRTAVAEPGHTAALVTPDRMLARRVATELARFDLPADDSGGMPLADTVPGSFMLRLAGLLAADCTVIGMLAVFKHPLFRLGLDRPAARRLVERFELLVLRGRKGRPDPSHLAGEVEAALRHHMDEQTHSRVLEAFSAGEIAAITAFAARFDAASAPLFAGPHTRTLSAWLDALVTFAEACATLDAEETGDTETDFGPLYAGDSGEALAQIMTSLIDAGAEYDVPREELAAVLAALFTGEAVKPQRGRHPRVFIWGTLEARLLTVDTMVLGGLNEGVWPPAPETGAFLSRLMRREIRLSPPERRIGQAAHDFEQALGIRHVVMTRALKAEGAPSEPSRWLQRLLAVAGPDGVASLRKAGQASLDIARRLDLAPSQPFVTRPAPTPPAALRPTHFSVTEIETLRQDPYAVFARRILRLRPLPELIRDPDARERGTLFHAILAEATRSGLNWAAPDAKARFAALARTLFDAEQLESDIEALWWPRFVALIPELADFESRRQALAATRLAEVISGKVPVGATGVTVAAVADRVDILNAGGVMILDYKTGSSPSKSDAQKLRSVQVALEAALAARGGFAETGSHGVHEVMFLRLGARGSATPEQIAPQTISHPDKSKTELTPEAFGDRAWQRLERLLYHFNTETNGYVSRANPLWQARYDQPYDHLARVLEWSAGGSEGEDGGDAGSDAS